MAILCLHHADDLDGKMSAYIVKRNLPECVCIGYSYSDEFPIDRFGKGDTVFVVDLCLTPAQLLQLTEFCYVIWIDHHQGSLDRFEEIKDKCKFFSIKLDTKESACYLTYQHFNPNKSVPLGIKLLSWADTGQWERDVKTKPFDYGVRSSNPSEGKTIIFDEIYEGIVDIKSIVSRGKAVLGYLDYYSETTLEPMSFEIEFEGYTALVLNVCAISTYTMKFWNPKWNPIFIRYFRKDNQWVVNIASEGAIDVSKICEKYGGSGHKNAAGFVCTALPFKV